MTTRDHIIDAADDLFYRQGYDHTSFADIAAAVNISRGNFYYHFKSKDQILAAVIELRLAYTQDQLQQWETEGGSPENNIRKFIEMLLANRADIKRHGCPVGTLSTELAKLHHGSLSEANELFSLFRVWLREQFHRLGRQADADELAMHLLVRSQGVAVMANAFGDEKIIDREVELLYEWLASQCEGHSTAGTAR